MPNHKFYSSGSPHLYYFNSNSGGETGSPILCFLAPGGTVTPKWLQLYPMGVEKSLEITSGKDWAQKILRFCSQSKTLKKKTSPLPGLFCVLLLKMLPPPLGHTGHFKHIFILAFQICKLKNVLGGNQNCTVLTAD